MKLGAYWPHRAICAFALLATCLCAPVAAADSEDQDAIADQAEASFWWGDFDTLDRLYVEATASSEINRFNARSAAQSVRSGVARVFQRDGNEAYYRELSLITERWASERPQSVFAVLLHARALVAQALHVRGGAYWSSVPPPAQREFTRLIKTAEAQIAKRAPMLMGDTSTHIYLMMIGRWGGWSTVKLRAMAEDGLSKGTRDEEVLYEELATALLPKWGGDLAAFARLAEEADARTSARRGHEIYALTYSLAASNVSGNEFRSMPARWQWIREGFQSLVDTRQHPYWVNRRAYMACLAEDRERAAQWIAELGDKVALQNWGGGGTAGEQNYESCVRWLKER